MKKSLLLILVISVLLVGCGKKEDAHNNPSMEVTSTSTTSEAITESTITKKTTTKTQTTKKTTTKKSTTEAKKVYKSVKTGKEHKYSFVYNDKATCIKKGDGDAFDIVNPKHPYAVFDCEEIEDANGKRLWGVVFYAQADDASIFYY